MILSPARIDPWETPSVPTGGHKVPETIVKAKNEWYPLDVPEGTTDYNGFSDKQKLTLSIGDRLPVIVATVFEELLGEKVEPSAVSVDFDKYHGQSLNQPDIKIIIGLKWSRKRKEMTDELRSAIGTHVQLFIKHGWRIDPGSSNYPSVSIKIEFTLKGGERRNQHGEVVSTY